MIDVIKTGPLRVNTLIVTLEEPGDSNSKNKVFIVDPACCDFSCDKDIIVHYLKEKSLEPVAIILTHGHFDHIAGLTTLKENFPDIKIYINKKDADCIGESGRKKQSQTLDAMGFSEFIPSVSNLPAPDEFLEDGNEIFGWTILETPGHTKGSVCLYNEKEGLLISGDTIFFHSYGRTDLAGGNDADMNKSLERIYKTIPKHTKVYPGHDITGFTLEENQ